MKNVLCAISLVLTFIPELSVAGIIQVDTAIEDKGTRITVIGHNEFTSSMTVTLHAPDWGDRAGTYSRGNREIFVIDAVITEHFFNVYPLVIDIPQPVNMLADITIPFFMATGPTATNLGPLPTKGAATTAEMQDGYGTWHPATMTSFSDVFDLPVAGPNGERYQWDLSGFTQKQGNFYLAKVTMTADQFSVPEPATLFLLLGAMPFFFGTNFKRRSLNGSRRNPAIGMVA